MSCIVVNNVQDLQRELTGAAKAGKRVAFVPTMGALHAGHAHLVKEAAKHADYVVVSIFVNPKQFSAGEDFDRYPRAHEQDIAMLRNIGVQLVYTPTLQDMYPASFTTSVSPGELGAILCGKSRPGHFDGVCTVVAKLLLRVLPHVALFGEKDYQQLCIIQQMVYDLDMPIEIIGVPTVRESDGLAMSSRNSYLSAQERAIAPKLYQILAQAADQIRSGGSIDASLIVAGTRLGSASFVVDYIECRHAITLQTLYELEKPARLLAAVKLGNTRLIDNIAIE